jgi:hypothetical protein
VGVAQTPLNGRASLQIDRVTADDYGYYDCVVENRVTSLRRSTLLIVDSELCAEICGN